MNKVDLLDDEVAKSLMADAARSVASSAGPAALYVSAVEGTGLEQLLERIDAMIEEDPVSRVRLRVPQKEGKALALLEAKARIWSRRYQDGAVELEVDAPESVVRKVREWFVARVRLCRPCSSAVMGRRAGFPVRSPLCSPTLARCVYFGISPSCPRFSCCGDAVCQRHDSRSRPHLHGQCEGSVGAGFGHHRKPHRCGRNRPGNTEPKDGQDRSHRSAREDGGSGILRFAYSYVVRRAGTSRAQSLDSGRDDHSGR